MRATPLRVAARLSVACALGVLCTVGCSAPTEGVRPPTPLRQRLGLPSPAHSSASPTPGPARGFLLDHLAQRTVRPGQVELVAALAGTSDGRSVQWSAEGATVLPGGRAGVAVIQVEVPEWSVQAALGGDGRELGRIASLPAVDGPVGASAAGGAWLAWSGSPPAVHIDGQAQPCSSPERRCWIDAAPGTLIRFEGGVVTAGAGPDLDGLTLEERPDECGDPWFPAPVGGGMAGCSEQGRLDRHRRRPGAPRRPIEAGTTLDPGRTSVTTDGDALVVAQARTLGLWRPRGATLAASSPLSLLSRPASDGAWIALPLPRAVLATTPGSPMRRQLAPSLEPGTLSTAAGWSAWSADGQSHLARLDADRGGPWPGEPDGAWVVPGWRVQALDGELRTWGLHGQPGWTAALDCAFSSARAVHDDILAVPFRSGAVVGAAFLHAPTGIELARVGDERAWAVPRGADSDGFVLWRRGPGTGGELVRYRTPIRILEEDAVVAPNRTGGHGGRHRVLAPGEAAQRSVRVSSPASLSAFRPSGPGDGWIEVSWDGGSKRVLGGGEGWVDLVAVPRDTTVTVRFAADDAGEGLVMDALMLGPTP